MPPGVCHRPLHVHMCTDHDRGRYRRGGPGPKRKFVRLNSTIFRAPLINVIFLPRNTFLMWVGAWGGGQPRLPSPPPARALIRPSGEDAMGRSCILDPTQAGGCPQ